LDPKRYNEEVANARRLCESGNDDDNDGGGACDGEVGSGDDGGDTSLLLLPPLLVSLSLMNECIGGDVKRRMFSFLPFPFPLALSLPSTLLDDDISSLVAIDLCSSILLSI
jgi:hypothetical protein